MCTYSFTRSIKLVITVHVIPNCHIAVGNLFFCPQVTHDSGDENGGEEIVAPDEVPREQDCDCCICHRCPTEADRFILYQAPELITRRKVGDFSLIDEQGHYICQPCTNFVTHNTKCPNWADGQWAQLYSLLCDDRFSLYASTTVGLLPNSIRSYWRHHIDSFSEQVRNLWDTNANFIDSTMALQQFNEAKALKWGVFAKVLNETCVESVVCPMGCRRHIDDSANLQLVPICHYLAHCILQLDSEAMVIISLGRGPTGRLLTLI